MTHHLRAVALRHLPFGARPASAPSTRSRATC